MIPSILFYVPLSFALLGPTTTPILKPGPTTPSFQNQIDSSGNSPMHYTRCAFEPTARDITIEKFQGFNISGFG